MRATGNLRENNDRLLAEAWWVTLKSSAQLSSCSDFETFPASAISLQNASKMVVKIFCSPFSILRMIEGQKSFWGNWSTRPTHSHGQWWSLFLHLSSVHPHFSKQNKFQAKTMVATAETVRLVEWIIDESCLVFCFYLLVEIEQAYVPSDIEKL